ncbi:PfkB family carbohydrate kinase [Paenibacillus beijingensis]|uniref:Fructokinase n=1 Tax=Paenibacillus beijingensis TaxID=1126833 RepID=A0A0D5NKP6_9BACL|nr:PfkB family carbohydrate kinase [Paenibacillus beijingensis]AJY75582.1 fructokinase [Paenibacillus beijingensis]
MATVYTIGEALIDFIPAEKGVALKDVSGFEKQAGGAPMNVACAVTKLGGKSAFIGKLGVDAFGDHLLETMGEIGVDTSLVVRTKEANTALAFVSLQADGNRQFSFYRNPSADMLLSEDEIDARLFSTGDILHYCSVDLIEAPVKYAHRKAIAAASAAGCVVSFDPNVRLPLWSDEEECRRTILEFLPLSDIVKISDEELAFITGIEDEAEAIQSLFTGRVGHVIYTKGSKGAVWYTREFSAEAPGLRVEAIDTTGAGDAFIGSLLFQVHRAGGAEGLASLTEQSALEFLSFANAAAAITTTRRGAVSSLPTLEEAEEMLAKA